MSRILLVEDEPLIADLLEDALRDEGLEVDVARSGSEAVFCLRSEPRSFAALVTDINLGDAIDGFQVAHEARALNPAVKVVYVSGRPSNLNVAEENALIFPKPFSVSALAEQVRLLAKH